MAKAHDAIKVGQYYYERAFQDPSSIIRDAKKYLKGVKFDTMVGSGLSGSLVVPILSRAFDVDMFIVRKGELNHSDTLGEGRIGHLWIFVDDFVSTGATRNRCKSAVQDIAREYENVGSTYMKAYVADGTPDRQ